VIPRASFQSFQSGAEQPVMTHTFRLPCKHISHHQRFPANTGYCKSWQQ